MSSRQSTNRTHQSAQSLLRPFLGRLNRLPNGQQKLIHLFRVTNLQQRFSLTKCLLKPNDADEETKHSLQTCGFNPRRIPHSPVNRQKRYSSNPWSRRRRLSVYGNGHWKYPAADNVENKFLFSGQPLPIPQSSGWPRRFWRSFEQDGHSCPAPVCRTRMSNVLFWV